MAIYRSRKTRGNRHRFSTRTGVCAPFSSTFFASHDRYGVGFYALSCIITCTVSVRFKIVILQMLVIVGVFGKRKVVATSRATQYFIVRIYIKQGSIARSCCARAKLPYHCVWASRLPQCCYNLTCLHKNNLPTNAAHIYYTGTLSSLQHAHVIEGNT